MNLEIVPQFIYGHFEASKTVNESIKYLNLTNLEFNLHKYSHII